MTNFSLTLESDPDPEDIRKLISKILEFNNNSQQDKDIAYPLSVFIRDAQGEIVGGLVGKTHWGWLFVSHLWVAETLRGQGYGQQLLLTAEQAAKQEVSKDCTEQFQSELNSPMKKKLFGLTNANTQTA